MSIPSYPCVQTYGGYHQIICSKGTVIRKSERCNGRCYHSYDQHSTQIGSEAHYSCPDGRCIPVKDSFSLLEDRCRGAMIGMCSNTTQECDENLFCHPQYSSRYNITTSGVTHYYCSLTKRRSTGVYDDIGRTDETTKTVTATQNKASESLIQCEVNYGSWPGLYCDHQCKVMKDWCTGGRLSFYKSAACNVDGNLIQRNDRDLCNDNLFWRGKGCFVKEYIAK